MKLRLKNFQSLAKADFELADFTLIVGPSNSGKTAVIRALAACLFNTPGTDYITEGKTEAAILFDDNENKITYSKGKSAKYQINDKGYAAIGRGPFSEVEKLGYRELNIDGVSIRPQFSFQHDAPYLISPLYTASTISAVFGSLSNSDLVRRAKHLNEKELKGLTSEVNAEQRLFEETDAKLQKYINFDALDQLYLVLLKLEKQQEEKEVQYKRGQSLLQEVNILKEQVNNISVIREASAIYSQSKILNEKHNNFIQIRDRQSTKISLQKIVAILQVLLIEIKILFESILKKKVLVEKYKEYRLLQLDLKKLVFEQKAIQKEWAGIKICPLCENKIHD